MAMEAAEVVMEAVEMAMAGAEMMGLVDGRSADAECDGSGGDGDGRGGQGRIHCKACKESSVGERIRVGAAQARALDGEAVACGAVAYPPAAAASRNSMVVCGGAGVRKAGSIAQRSKPDFRLVRLCVCLSASLSSQIWVKASASRFERRSPKFLSTGRRGYEVTVPLLALLRSESRRQPG